MITDGPPVVAHPRVYDVEATAYSPCSSGDINASGTHTRFGQLAVNFLPLGTKVKLLIPHSLHGRRTFYIRDRIGWGTETDVFLPNCAEAIRFGRRRLRYEVIA